MKLNSKFSMIVALTVLQVAFLTIISFSGLNKCLNLPCIAKNSSTGSFFLGS